MSDPPSSLAVRVPCSTSNLGPGFDLLGLALALPLSARVLGPAPGEEPVLELREGEAARWPRDEERFLAGVRAATAAGDGGPPLAYAVRSEIPVGRGFGSSGAAAAAGLLLGAATSRAPASRELLHELGVALEGHPDNVTASLFGGLTLCHPDARGGRPLLVRGELSPSIGVALAWSDVELSTAEARRALPADVPFAEAAENPRRLALLLAGLRSGDPTLLAAGGEDHLHVPWRLPRIPGAREALEAAREAGAWLATISGAGSGLVALGPRDDPAGLGRIAEAMATELERRTTGAEARVVEPALDEPRVQRS